MEGSNESAPLVKSSLEQAYILIVEDDDGIGFMLKNAVQQETPYDALLVSEGEEALHLIAKRAPRLVILDYQLPGINGLEVADRIHAMDGLEQLPLLLISAYLPKRELTRRKLHGMSKPFDLEKLLALMNRLLSS